MQNLQAFYLIHMEEKRKISMHDQTKPKFLLELWYTYACIDIRNEIGLLVPDKPWVTRKIVNCSKFLSYIQTYASERLHTALPINTIKFLKLRTLIHKIILRRNM